MGAPGYNRQTLTQARPSTAYPAWVEVHALRAGNWQTFQRNLQARGFQNVTVTQYANTRDLRGGLFVAATFSYTQPYTQQGLMSVVASDAARAGYRTTGGASFNPVPPGYDYNV